MKKKILFIIFTFFAYFFITSNYSALTRTKIVDSSDATIVDYGTSTDAKYAYSFRVNNNSKITETNANQFGNLTVQRTDDRFIFVPNSNEGSGEAYVFIEDLGKYNGKQVDLKLTFTWKTAVVDNKTIYPLIDIYLDHTRGQVNNYFKTLAYEVTYEVYSEGKPLRIDLSFLLGDIDYNQYFGVKANNGLINSVQAISDSSLYIEKSGGYNWVYDEEREPVDYDSPMDLQRKHMVRFELENSSSFNLVVGADLDSYSYADIFTIPIIDSADPDTGLLYVNPTRATELLLDYYNVVLNNITTGVFDTGVVTLSAKAFGPYTIPKPELFIRDVDNQLKKLTVLTDLDNQVVYETYAQVPAENSDFYYTSYEMDIDIPEEVFVDSFEVRNESGENVTNYFEVDSDGKNNYVFKVKDSILANDKFYNDTYIIRFNTVLTEDTRATIIKEGGVSFEAVSNLIVKRGGSINEAPTNKVVTTAVLEDSGFGFGDIEPETESESREFKITTDVVNGKIDGSVTVNKKGEDVTINYEADEGYVISKLIIDGEEIEINGYKTSYTFKNIDKDHSIKVVYEIENPKTGAYIGFGLLTIFLIGFISFNIYSKRKTKLYRI